MRIFTAFLLACGALAAGQYGIQLTGSAQPACSSVEEIVAAVTQGARTDREKALALHRFGMAHFIHFNGPVEQRDLYVTDPLKLISVYGYCLCGNNSAAMTGLYNAAGLKARVRVLHQHAIPEVWFENKWNYLDTDMFGYLYLPDGKTIASVDEVFADPDLFIKQKNPPNPYFPFDQKKDMADVFRDRVNSKNYHPYPNAHVMRLGLRAGESATLYFRPRGRFYLGSSLPRALGTEYPDYWQVGAVRKGSLAWTDRPPAAYGNGVLEYAPDLRSDAFRLENPERAGVAVNPPGKMPELVAAAVAKPASLVVEVTTPWIVSGRQNDLTNAADDSAGAVATGRFWRGAPGDENRIWLSTDHGRTWKQVWENRYLGTVPFQVDITRWVEGRHSYLLKFEWLDRRGAGQVGLEGLRIETWVQLSPMALARIAPGANTFRLGTAPERAWYNQSRWDRGEPIPGQRLVNLAAHRQAPWLRPSGPERPGVLTFPLGPRAAVAEARISVLASCIDLVGDPKVTLSLSSDGGGHWRKLAHFTPDPEQEMSRVWYNYTLRDLPEGGRTWLKVEVSEGGLEQVIANAIVRERPAAPGTLRVTNVWRESGREQTASHLLEPGAAPLDYAIDAAASGIENVALRFEAK